MRLWLAPVVLILSIGCGGENQSLAGPSAVGGTPLLSAEGGGSATAADAGEFETLGRGPGRGGGHGRDKDRDGNRDGNRDDDSGDGNGGPGRGGDDHRGPGRGNDDDDDNRGPGRGGDEDPGRRDDARVVGFVSTAGADTITVNGVVIAAGPAALIRHGRRSLTLADIEVGDHVQARGSMEEGVLVATEIKVQDTADDDDEIDDITIEGAVAGLSPASGCPVITFTIGSTTIRTSAATMFDDVTCATLANTTFVEVDGVRQADGSILAARVELE